ncbi:MAG: response regulator, partial [Actinomycetota bacterium]
MATADRGSQGDEAGDQILIVDDEEPIRRMLARLLETHGYPTLTAADVEEARSRLDEQEFSLILADMSMPGGSGLDLLTHVRQNRPETAIIMVTGMADTSL